MDQQAITAIVHRTGHGNRRQPPAGQFLHQGPDLRHQLTVELSQQRCVDVRQIRRLIELVQIHSLSRELQLLNLIDQLGDNGWRSQELGDDSDREGALLQRHSWPFLGLDGGVGQAPNVAELFDEIRLLEKGIDGQP